MTRKDQTKSDEGDLFARRAAAKAKFKTFALWYMLMSLPICLIMMFWPMDDIVSGHGKAAHYIAVPLAFLSGLFFMGIIFFSSHSGGDEQPNYVEMMERQKREEDRAHRRSGESRPLSEE